MQREINPRIVVAIIAVIVVIVGAVAWRMFGGGGGQQTAAQAGLGKPMHPGEIPGKRPAIGETKTGLPSGR